MTRHTVTTEYGVITFEFVPNPITVYPPGYDGWPSSGDEEEWDEEESAFNRQVGGSHYKDLPIQPTEYITKNGLNFAEGNVIKYITRHKLKGGLEDLEKARHYIDMLIELEKNKHES